MPTRELSLTGGSTVPLEFRRSDGTVIICAPVLKGKGCKKKILWEGHKVTKHSSVSRAPEKMVDKNVCLCVCLCVFSTDAQRSTLHHIDIPRITNIDDYNDEENHTASRGSYRLDADVSNQAEEDSRPPIDSHRVHIVPSRQQSLTGASAFPLQFRPGETAELYVRSNSVIYPYRPACRCSMYPIQVIDADENYENSCAVLIAGRGKNQNKTTAHRCHVYDVEYAIIDSIIPQSNIKIITPYENYKENEIEYILSDIISKRCSFLFIYFSGEDHSVQYLDVSDDQGNALNVLRIREFISSLSNSCKVHVLLDCCRASEILLLPEFPNTFIAERDHIQWSSCKAGGRSLGFERCCSLFTSCFISALKVASKCPECPVECPIHRPIPTPSESGTRATTGIPNCGLCSRFTESVCKEGGITSENFNEHAEHHIRRMFNILHIDYRPCDLPDFIINPTARY